MSSIIDALKKSDQNRNNGQQADVKNIQFSDKLPPKSRRGFWLLVLLLLLVAVGVYAWQQGWHHQLLGYFQTSQATKSTATNTPQPKQKKPPVTVAKNQEKTKSNQLIPPKQSEIKAKTEQAKKEKLNQMVADEEIKPIDGKKTATKPLKRDFQVKQESNKPAITQNKPVLANKDTDLAMKNDSKISSSDSVKPNSKNQSLEPVLKQDYLLLHQIDFAIRKNIPPVKINIHIYDPEPENRMVLINGERYNIGDSIEDILTVTDIVKEGIVVSFENLHFLIPK